MSSEQIAAIILAAGASSRMGLAVNGQASGIKKEYQKLSSGVTVLETAVRVFASVPCIDKIVIAVCENTEARDVLPPDFLAEREACKPEIIFVSGGATRRASALNSLRVLPRYNPRYVLIHDGARPFVPVPLIESIITAVKKYNAVIPLLPITDTPKELGMTNVECGMWNEERRTENREQGRESGEQDAVFIKRHLRRANIGIAQTPQAFKFPEILYAHEKAVCMRDEEFTDDAEVWGRFCGQVAVIPGDPANRKITFKEDLISNN